MSAELWSVYCVRTARGALYTGISTDVVRRFQQHVAGKVGSRSLRGKGPLTLAFAAEIGDRAAASRVEARIKRLSKAQKEALVSGQRSLTELGVR